MWNILSFSSFWLFHVFKLYFSLFVSTDMHMLYYVWSHFSMWVVGHLKLILHRSVICFMQFIFRTKYRSVKLYHLILHIMSWPWDKFKSRQWNLCLSHIFFLSVKPSGYRKMFFHAQYRLGHNHSVARVCQSARQFVLRSKSCIYAGFFLLVRKCCALQSHFLLVLCWQKNCQLCFEISCKQA